MISWLRVMTNTIARIFFIVVFVLVSGGLVVWETTSLMAISKPKQDTAVIKEFRFGEWPVVGSGNNQVNLASNQSGESVKIVADDARPLLIKRYLAKYQSPLLPYADLIFQMSQTYGYDYRWIIAIAQQESNLCKKIPDNSFNCWGYGINSAGTLRFTSYELAIKSFGEYLKREYFDKGLTTPETIMKKYCPPSNGSWAYGVSQFFNDIEKG